MSYYWTPSGTTRVVWRPQPGPQSYLMRCPAPEIFFGGARGGGKTDGVLGKWYMKSRQYGKFFNAMMFRRTTVSSEDAIERSRQIYGPMGGVFNSTTKTWRMPDGGKIGFAYLDSLADADEYQGRNLTDVWVEEAGQYPDPAPIDRLNGVLRSASGVPTQLILTGNPGGPGQHWIRDRYQLHPFPRRPQILIRPLPDGRQHQVCVIPSRLEDNRVLMDADPEYIGRLYQVGSAELVRSWLEGDWSAVEGAFFDGWSPKRHIVEPFEVPADWLRFQSLDWGYARPSSVGWWAVAGDTHETSAGLIPRGCLVRYREIYTATKPNTGMRLDAEELAKKIKAAESEAIDYRVADPAIFAEDGGPSIAERMARVGVVFRRGDNRRVGQSGAMGGWDQMRARIRGDADGRPMLAVFSTCRDFIRTVPVLQHDPMRPEDLDTDAEDHIADEARYACMSRPWVPHREPRRDAVADMLRKPTAAEVFGMPGDDY